MARPLVHQHDRPGFQGGSAWACPFCAHQVVYWRLHHKVLVKGQAEVLHVRATTEVPVHLDDLVVELTEADSTGCPSTPSPGLAWWPDNQTSNPPACAAAGSARQQDP